MSIGGILSGDVGKGSDSTTEEILKDPADIFGGSAGRQAREAATRSAQTQLAELRRQFDIGQERIEPFFQEAVPAFQLQAALSGAQGPEAQAEAFQNFQDSPGTQFLREQGLRGIESGAASGGGLGGGQRLRELTKFSQGLALQDFEGQFNRLGVVSGRGQAAGSELAGRGAQFAGQFGNVVGQESQAIQQSLQAQQQQTSSVAGAGLGALAAIFSDENMKTDISKMSDKECFDTVMSTPIKVWKYLKECGIDENMHIGPMVQEAPECITNENSINFHDELWLIAGAMKHMHTMGAANHG